MDDLHFRRGCDEMNLFSGVLNFLVFMFFIRVVFTILAALKAFFTPRAEAREKAPASGFLEAVEASRAFEAVKDEHCGVLVPRSEAYILMAEDGPHYFCSWDCRQDYISKMKSEEAKYEA